MKKNVDNVEEFVVQLEHLTNINLKFQSVRDQVSLVEQFMTVLLQEKEGNKQGNKEDAANLKNAQQKINDLTSEVQKVESSEDVQKDKFKK